MIGLRHRQERRVTTMSVRYTVSVLNGHWCEEQDEYAPCLTYVEMLWEDALTLIHLSLAAGFEVVAREVVDEDGEQ